MSNNGNIESNEAFKGQEIEFPVTFELKAVMAGTEDEEKHKENLEKVFNNLKIDFSYVDKKISSKGSYISFTYKVTVVDKVQMEALYSDMKKIKELKFAV